MDVDAAELQDWELLQPNPNSDKSGHGDPSENPSNTEEIGAESEGMVYPNYFTIDSQNRPMNNTLAGADEPASDNPGLIEPVSEPRYPGKDRESWPDSGSDRSDDRKFEGIGEIGNLGDEKNLGGSDEIEGVIGGNGEKSEEFWSDSVGIQPDRLKLDENDDELRDGSEEFAGKAHKNGGETRVIGGDGKKLEELWSDSVGIQPDRLKLDENDDELRDGSEEFAGKTHKNGGETRDEIVEIEAKKAEEARKSVVWWKVPYELLKFYVLRANPIWTFSAAAAMMGFVILGRHLYKMRKKTRSLHIKVAMDDKKVSQFMSRAARLNEAFLSVRRVPVIRPQLSAAGIMPWPVISQR